MYTYLELLAHHKNYSIYRDKDDPWVCLYSAGEIESLQKMFNTAVSETDKQNDITVRYRNGEVYNWKTKYIDAYNSNKTAVSADGKYVFAQTWENGLFCFDAKTGKRIWRTQSRRGITSVFVNDSTIVCQQHERAMQLIDMHTGEVIKEKRPSTAWGFTALDNRHIICQVTAKRWEIIEAETLDVKESFTHKKFTDGHTEFCVNRISLMENGVVCVKGFQNVWDDSVRPPKMLPNMEFEHLLKSDYLSRFV